MLLVQRWALTGSELEGLMSWAQVSGRVPTYLRMFLGFLGLFFLYFYIYFFRWKASYNNNGLLDNRKKFKQQDLDGRE